MRPSMPEKTPQKPQGQSCALPPAWAVTTPADSPIMVLTANVAGRHPTSHHHVPRLIAREDLLLPEQVHIPASNAFMHAMRAWQSALNEARRVDTLVAHVENRRLSAFGQGMSDSQNRSPVSMQKNTGSFPKLLSDTHEQKSPHLSLSTATRTDMDALEETPGNDQIKQKTEALAHSTNVRPQKNDNNHHSVAESDNPNDVSENNINLPSKLTDHKDHDASYDTATPITTPEDSTLTESSAESIGLAPNQGLKMGVTRVEEHLSLTKDLLNPLSINTSCPKYGYPVQEISPDPQKEPSLPHNQGVVHDKSLDENDNVVALALKSDTHSDETVKLSLTDAQDIPVEDDPGLQEEKVIDQGDIQTQLHDGQTGHGQFIMKVDDANSDCHVRITETPMTETTSIILDEEIFDDKAHLPKNDYVPKEVKPGHSLAKDPLSTQIVTSKKIAETKQYVALEIFRDLLKCPVLGKDVSSSQEIVPDELLQHPPDMSPRDAETTHDPQPQQDTLKYEQKDTCILDDRLHEQSKQGVVAQFVESQDNEDEKVQDTNDGKSTYNHRNPDKYTQMELNGEAKSSSPQASDAYGMDTPGSQVEDAQVHHADTQDVIYDAIKMTGVPQSLDQLEAVASQFMELFKRQEQSDHGYRHLNHDPDDPNYWSQSDHIYNTLKQTDEFIDLQDLQRALSKSASISNEDTWTTFHRYDSVDEMSSHIRLMEQTGLSTDFQMHQKDTGLATQKTPTGTTMAPPAHLSSFQNVEAPDKQKTQDENLLSKSLRHQDALLALLNFRASLPVAPQSSYVQSLNEITEVAVRAYNASTPYVQEGSESCAPQEAPDTQGSAADPPEDTREIRSLRDRVEELKKRVRALEIENRFLKGMRYGEFQEESRLGERA